MSKQYGTGIKRTHSPMNRTEGSRNKPMHVRSTNIWQESQGILSREQVLCTINNIGKIGYSNVKNETIIPILYHSQ